MSDYGSAPPPPPPPPDDSGQGSYPGMQSMSGGTPPPAGPVSQPRSIANAVKLMYVGAALSVVGILITLFMRDTIREQVEKGAADAGRDMSPSDVDAAVAVAVGFSVVVGLLGVGLWLWMAWANGRGKKWARIVATVLPGRVAGRLRAGGARVDRGARRPGTAVAAALPVVLRHVAGDVEELVYFLP